MENEMINLEQIYPAWQPNLLTSDRSQNLSGTDFSQILETMLLSMISTDKSGEASFFSNLLAPALMRLLNELMTQEIASPTPSGMPIDGYLTQSSHAGHRALDFGAPVGTPVQATMDGQVVFAGWNKSGYGNLVILENGDYRTYYAHLSEIPVRVGQTIREGEVLGLSGNTGNSTGPHLHYEIRLNDRPIDPTSLTRDQTIVDQNI